MSGLVNALLIVAVAGLVIARQFRASRVETGPRSWVLPGILALREPELVDPQHHTASAPAFWRGARTACRPPPRIPRRTVTTCPGPR
ncbi:hypothetical protein ALMP_21110 [Streptomyces sp. A012304]|nr:hypothetical protein ALMP_21110 [Streptomyces sp. A012304]